MSVITAAAMLIGIQSMSLVGKEGIAEMRGWREVAKRTWDFGCVS